MQVTDYYVNSVGKKEPFDAFVAKSYKCIIIPCQCSAQSGKVALNL